ncbi:MAG: tetratricopeptide repeat protein, partial [Flavipsychrobacter sp.]|nr:tetratricopeptide repeat protein [Flavipsychrobacter sp.]
MANKQPQRPAQKPIQKPATAPPPAKTVPQPKATGAGYSLKTKLALLLGIFAFLLYVNTLKNGYVLDDSSVITENTIVVKGISAIPEILTTPYRRGFFVTSNDLYRPLSLVMMAIEYQFFGMNPMPSHLINVLLFAGCVVLLFFFLDKLFDEKKTAVAFIASLLFAAHPIHTEVVANIKSGDELLCFLFVFLSMNIFVKYIETGKMKQLILGCACFFLSFLSKETVVTFLAVIPMTFFFYRNENKKRSIHITVGIVIMTALALMLRVSVLSAYNANGIADIDFADNGLALKTLPYASRIATAVLILGYYIKLLFIPYPLVCDYAYNTIPFTTFSDPRVLASLAIYLFLGIFGAIRLFKNNKDPYAYAILFFLITISLFSNIPFLIGSTMGERFMFFGLLGLCMVIALLLEKWVSKTATDTLAIIKSPKVLAVIIPVCLAYSAIAIDRNGDWYSNFTLYHTDIANSPNSSKLNYFLGLEYEKVVAEQEKDPVKQKQIRLLGMEYLKKSLAIDPDLANAQSDLGNAYSIFQQLDSAEVHEKRALELMPNSTMTAGNLAGVYYFNKKYRESIDLSLKTIAMKPDFISAYGNLGRCYLALGKVDSTIFILNKAITIDPNYNFAYEVLAI